jgi:hypothetical protein
MCVNKMIETIAIELTPSYLPQSNSLALLDIAFPDSLLNDLGMFRIAFDKEPNMVIAFD